MSERTIWICAGLLGLAVAVGLALLMSRVSQPPVGVPGEPVSAGQQLAPARTAARAQQPARTPVRTTTPAAAPPAADDDDDAETDSSGPGSGDDDDSGRGRGRGRGGDD